MKKRLLPIFVGLILLSSLSIIQFSTQKWSYFSMIPVLHEGRIKPLDTLARLHIRENAPYRFISYDQSEAWLAESLFRPMQSAQNLQFSVDNADIRQLLSLPKRNSNIYSFNDLATSLDDQAKDLQNLIKADHPLTKDQRTLVELYARVMMHGQFMASMMPILPLSTPLPEIFISKKGKNTLFDYITAQPYGRKSDKILSDIIRKKGTDTRKYTPEEISIMVFSYQMRAIEQAGRQNTLLRIIPPFWKQDQNEWFTPWVVLMTGRGSPSSAMLFASWKNVAMAYLDADDTKFKIISQKLLAESFSVAKLSKIQIFKIKTEVFYNILNPFFLAFILYISSFGMVLVDRLCPQKKWLMNGASYALDLGVALHMIAIGLRIFILSRPPIGTLYESFLFVSMLCPAITTLLFYRTHNRNFLSCGGILGAAILGIAFLHGSEGDTLEMLVAVLNTNFWLGTHVVCITAGYSVSLLAGTMAHLKLIEHAVQRRKALSISDQVLHGTALTALLLMVLGTMLGGIWADQSWGRFWGWDPKENGALLIVLWLLWLLHGKIAGVLNNTLYAAVLSFINVIVALSWFGVNLLGVGLHSYGFTSGISLGLLSFCLAETIFIISLYSIARIRNKMAHA